MYEKITHSRAVDQRPCSANNWDTAQLSSSQRRVRMEAWREISHTSSLFSCYCYDLLRAKVAIMSYLEANDRTL